MTYFGWQVYGYQYRHDEPGLQESISKEILSQNIQTTFCAPDWSVSEENGLTITTDQVVIRVELHAWDLTIEYDNGAENETYLCKLSSDAGLTWKRTERDHRNLMHRVFRQLPWVGKVSGWIEEPSGAQLTVVRSTNIEWGFEPFTVTPRRWEECPIPERIVRPRRRILRLKPATSYLGTRTKIPRGPRS